MYNIMYLHIYLLHKNIVKKLVNYTFNYIRFIIYYSSKTGGHFAALPSDRFNNSKKNNEENRDI